MKSKISKKDEIDKRLGKIKSLIKVRPLSNDPFRLFGYTFPHLLSNDAIFN